MLLTNFFNKVPNRCVAIKQTPDWVFQSSLGHKLCSDALGNPIEVRGIFVPIQKPQTMITTSVGEC